MTDFIIDTPSHKRWFLPDRRHQINSVIYGDRMRMSVMDGSGRYPDQFVVYIDLNKSNWQELADVYHDLAKKRFPDKSLKRAPAILAGPPRRF